MKIFAITEMIDMSITVKIQKDDGQFIVLRGKRDDQHMPAYGIDLFEGEQERLIEWINRMNGEKIETAGTGQLLFHNKESAAAILPKIHKQIELCENDDESKCFRIDWRILYGDKTK